jgi:hypothetical protein
MWKDNEKSVQENTSLSNLVFECMMHLDCGYCGIALVVCPTTERRNAEESKRRHVEQLRQILYLVHKRYRIILFHCILLYYISNIGIRAIVSCSYTNTDSCFWNICTCDFFFFFFFCVNSNTTEHLHESTVQRAATPPANWQCSQVATRTPPCICLVNARQQMHCQRSGRATHTTDLPMYSRRQQLGWRHKAAQQRAVDPAAVHCRWPAQAAARGAPRGHNRP